MGAPIDDFVQLPSLLPNTSRNGSILARVIQIDRFGNCVTNITERELTAQTIAGGTTIQVKGKQIKSFRRFFAETGSKEKLFAVWGSAGFLELAAANNSAARMLKVQRGEEVMVLH